MDWEDRAGIIAGKVAAFVLALAFLFASACVGGLIFSALKAHSQELSGCRINCDITSPISLESKEYRDMEKKYSVEKKVAECLRTCLFQKTDGTIVLDSGCAQKCLDAK